MMSRDLVGRVYRDIWHDYSAWSLSDSRSTLDGLHKPTVPSPKLQLSSQTFPHSVSEEDESFTITDYSPNTTTTHITAQTIVVPKPITPYPPYDACTPISRNLMVGDDPDLLPFVPFSDDPTYDYAYDFQEYTYFKWDHESFVLDPDLEVVAYETARRLLVEHDVSHEDIEQTGVLPFSMDVILNLNRQRDFPKWRPKSDFLPLPRPTSTVTNEPNYVMNYFQTTFCNNLNCITGFCTTHLETQLPNPVASRIADSKLVDGVSRACGYQCFLEPSTSSTAIGTHWTPTDLSLLSSILAYTPDALPCDISLLCRKPCREVYRYRKRAGGGDVGVAATVGLGLGLGTGAGANGHVGTGTGTAGTGRGGKAQGSVGARSFQESSKLFTPNLPCRHPGPCDARSGCACFNNKAHCRTRCGCAKTCPRKWKGCACAKSHNLCGTNKCSCFKANVECDPEVCLTCEARDHKSTMCRNVGIQRGSFKKTYVRESQWGLGLFILESCEKGDLIAEYVGELIYEPTVRSRDTIATHNKRSYVFVLNPTISVDSAHTGNETRYMNHSSDPNCYTTVYLVNGEHRIGVYAAKSIEEEEELLIDYGPWFFKAGPGQSQSQDVPEKEKKAVEEEEEPPFVLPVYDHSSDETYSTEAEEGGSGSAGGTPRRA